MIVITGAAGFIGSRLVLALNALGHRDIMVVDYQGDAAKSRNLANAHYKVWIDPATFLQGVQSEKPDLGLGFGSPRVVFHQGACSDTTVSDADFVERVNVVFSVSLLRWCSLNRVQCIYASSASVYGNGDNGFLDRDSRCENPLNLYAKSKQSVDAWYKSNSEQFASQVVGLRYFNVYGEQENHKGRMASVIYQFHHQIQRDNTLRLFAGSENFVRDFVHVQDVVAVNLYFWENPHLSGIFNVGTGLARSFLDIAQIMLEVNPGAKMEFVPFPQDLKGKYQAFTQANLDSLQKAGFKNGFIALEEGVLSYAHNLREFGGFISLP